MFLNADGRGRGQGRERSLWGTKPELVGEANLSGKRRATHDGEKQETAQGETAYGQTAECSAKHPVPLARSTHTYLYAAAGGKSIGETSAGGVADQNRTAPRGQVTYVFRPFGSPFLLTLENRFGSVRCRMLGPAGCRFVLGRRRPLGIGEVIEPCVVEPEEKVAQ